MRVKEESEKAGLKLNIQKSKTMTSSPITSRERERENMKGVTDFTFLGSKSLQTVATGMKLKDAMAPHSCTLAWKIPWMEEPGGLQSMGSLGV